MCTYRQGHSAEQIRALLISYYLNALRIRPIIFIPNDQDKKAAIFTVIDITSRMFAVGIDNLASIP
jgi:hypothetical protein